MGKYHPKTPSLLLFAIFLTIKVARHGVFTPEALKPVHHAVHKVNDIGLAALGLRRATLVAVAGAAALKLHDRMEVHRLRQVPAVLHADRFVARNAHAKVAVADVRHQRMPRLKVPLRWFGRRRPRDLCIEFERLRVERRQPIVHAA